MASFMCLQVQDWQLPALDNFVALIIWPKAGHWQWLIFASQKLFLRVPRPKTLGGQFQTETEHYTDDTFKGYLRRDQDPLGQILLCLVSPHTAACTLWSWPILIASQPESHSDPQTYQQQSRLNHNIRAHLEQQFPVTRHRAATK